jgi:hypothetical protein
LSFAFLSVTPAGHLLSQLRIFHHPSFDPTPPNLPKLTYTQRQEIRVALSRNNADATLPSPLCNASKPEGSVRMLSRRISSTSLLSFVGALALMAGACLPKTLHAQDLPIAPSSVFSAGTPTESRTLPGTTLFGTRSLFLIAPSAGHLSVFLTPVHPISPLLFYGPQNRTVNPFALFSDAPTATSSSFVLGGFNLNAGLAHGRQNGAAPLNGFSVSTKTSGMDFSLSGGVGGSGFNRSGFGPPSESFGNRGSSVGAPGGGATPQLSLRLKF